jgi:hypothetical protein
MIQCLVSTLGYYKEILTITKVCSIPIPKKKKPIEFARNAPSVCSITHLRALYGDSRVNGLTTKLSSNSET